MQHRFQNITCRAVQAALKVYLPRRHIHLPRHSAKQRWVTLRGLCPKHYLPSRENQGLPNLLATCLGASGYVAHGTFYNIPFLAVGVLYSTCMLIWEGPLSPLILVARVERAPFSKSWFSGISKPYLQNKEWNFFFDHLHILSSENRQLNVYHYNNIIPFLSSEDKRQV